MAGAGGRALRILQVMRAPVGGLFRHVGDLARELAARGHLVGLAVDSLAGDARTEEALGALAPELALGLHRFAMPRVLGPGDVTVPFALRRLGRRLGVEIYHGHGAKGGFHARLAAPRAPGVATFYTPHGGVLHFNAATLSGRLFHRLERMLMARTGAIIFESEYARETYGRVIGMPTCPTRVVHNGLRPEEFVPVPPDPDAADFVFVGELRALKGVGVLLEALGPLRRPDGRPATLHIVGDGADRTKFERAAFALGIAGRVVFAGAGPARAAFARGRCAVVPSLAESLPYVVMEAAAARLPVIATDVGGIGEIFGPTANSLVPPNDPAALGAAMQEFLGDPTGARREMERRLTHVGENFSSARMADAIEALYLKGIATG